MKSILFAACFFFLEAVPAQNVGIGTATPNSSAVLDISSSTKGLLIPRVIDAQNSIPSPANGLLVYDPSRGVILNYAVNEWKTLLNSDDQYWNRSAGRVHLVNNGDKIGIGTSNPAARLQINHRNTAASPAINLLDSSTGTGSTILFSKLGTANTFGLNCILTTVPANNAFHIQHGATTPILSVRGDNRVGINQINPVEALEVNGNIKADTVKPAAIRYTPNAAKGKVLTSDESGNASWQEHLVNGSVGFGTWGDCSMNGISEYNPVADTAAAEGDQFGSGVAISGNFAIVGAMGDDIDGKINQGSASVYRHDGLRWQFVQRLTDPAGLAQDLFGASIAIEGDWAIIGCFGDAVGPNFAQGSVCIFHFNGTSWEFMQKLTDPAGASGDQFGASVALSGNYAIIGAPMDDVISNTDMGTACIFQLNGTNWTLMQKFADPGGAANDNFGKSVSISGDYAVIGSPMDNVSGIDEAGSAAVFHFNGSSWVFTQELSSAISGAAGGHYGTSVSISGNYIIIGAPDRGPDLAEQGEAFLYLLTGTSWFSEKTFRAPNPAANDRFGYSVCISGDYIVVGVLLDDENNLTNSGSAMIYFRMGLSWGKIQTVTDPGGNSSDVFSQTTAFDGVSRRFLIGTQSAANSSGKAVFGKLN